jgi:hypothetical protein
MIIVYARTTYNHDGLYLYGYKGIGVSVVVSRDSNRQGPLATDTGTSRFTQDDRRSVITTDNFPRTRIN